MIVCRHRQSGLRHDHGKEVFMPMLPRAVPASRSVIPVCLAVLLLATGAAMVRAESGAISDPYGMPPGVVLLTPPQQDRTGAWRGVVIWMDEQAPPRGVPLLKDLPIIGHLFRIRDTTPVRGIPLLSDLPIIGRLFRNEGPRP
jgi:hypothetical protein